MRMFSCVLPRGMMIWHRHRKTMLGQEVSKAKKKWTETGTFPPMVRPCSFHPYSDHKLHNGTWDACWFVKIPMVYLLQHWSSGMTCFPAISHTGKKKTPCQPEVSWACTPRRTPKVQRQRGDSNASWGSLTVNFEVSIWAHFLILPDHDSCGNEQSLYLSSTRQTLGDIWC